MKLEQFLKKHNVIHILRLSLVSTVENRDATFKSAKSGCFITFYHISIKNDGIKSILR